MTSNLLPQLLVDQIFSRRCVLFLGSGASVDAGAPTAAQLAQELADRFLDGRHRTESLARVAAYIEHKPGLGRNALINYLVNRFEKLSPSKAHYELTKYPWAAIYTTNYDTLIEQAYETAGKSVTKILKSSDLSTVERVIDFPLSSQTASEILLLKLHGCISTASSEETPLVISEDDYVKTRINKGALLRLLELHRYTHTFLFIGYSFGDPDLSQIWTDVSSELGRLYQWAYAVWPGCSEEQRMLWRGRYVEPIDCTFSELFSKLAERREVNRSQPVRYIPDEFLFTLADLLAKITSTRFSSFNPEELERLVELIGQEMHLPARDLRDLKLAALICEIGIVGVPDQILFKERPLTQDEFEILKSYPVIGERLISDIPGLERVSRIIRCQSERYDGSGYPNGIKGAQILLSARILTAAKVLLTLITKKPYRPALPLKKAAEELQELSGTILDPEVTQILLALVKKGKIKQIFRSGQAHD